MNGKLVRWFTYRNEKGEPIYVINRYEPKRFSVERLDGKGGWMKGLGDIKPVLYNLDMVVGSLQDLPDEPIYVCEGERDCDNLVNLGFVATTNPFGADSWKDEYSEYLKGANVVIFPDNDEPGERHALKVAHSLHGKAKTIKIVKVPIGKDISDWLEVLYGQYGEHGKSGQVTKEQIRNAILEVVDKTPYWQPDNEQASTIDQKLQTDRKTILDQITWTPFRDITRKPEQKWLIDRLIAEGNLVILSARPKTGKSIVGLNIAASIAMGKPFLNRQVIQSRSYFAAWERHDLTVERATKMGLNDCAYFTVWDRYKAMGNGKELGDPPYIDEMDWWLQFLSRENIKLVVFDTLRGFLMHELKKVPNAMNSYDYISTLLHRVATVAHDTRCTFVLIHHDAKGDKDTSEQKVLGSTALTAAADVIMQIEPSRYEQGVSEIKVTGNAIDEQRLWFNITNDFWLVPTDKPATNKQAQAANAILAQLKEHGQRTRQELIQYLIEVGLAEPPKDGQRPKTAESLLDRALNEYLKGKVEISREGKAVTYKIPQERIL